MMNNFGEMQLRLATELVELRAILGDKYHAKLATVKNAITSVKHRLSQSTVIRDIVTSVQKRIGPYKQPIAVEKFYTLIVEISSTVQVKIVNGKRRKLLVATLGKEVPRYTEYSVQRVGDTLTVQYFDYGQLIIEHRSFDDNSHQYDIQWQLASHAVPQRLHDHFSFGDSHTYGGCLHREQTWPLTSTHKLSPYLSSDLTHSRDVGYGSIVERYWLSSAGLAVYVDPEVPLFAALNNGNTIGVTLVSQYKEPYRNIPTRALFLKYSLFQCADVKHAYDTVRHLYFPKCSVSPHEDLFLNTIWQVQNSPAAKAMTSGSVLQYVNDILKHGFVPGTLEIGDNWTDAFGDMDFDHERFPETKAVMQSIKNKGFRVILWVHPFASPTSKVFYSPEELWIKSHRIDAVTTWKHGIAKVLDATNPTAQLWFETNLKILKKKFDVDGFHFDCGEASYLPNHYQSHELLHSPEKFSQCYINMAHRLSAPSNFGLVGTGCRTQDVPLVINMEDKDSNWGKDNGLKTVIPTVLSISLMGYAFVLPGTVGGRRSKVTPSKELYLRWLETVILMPVVKLSLPPWYYGEDVVDIVHKLFTIRKRLLDYLLKQVAVSVETGAPMVRPMWWLAPRDSIGLTIDSQYMVGERLMVAPVQEQGATHRTIYLPPGTWRDELRGVTLHGGRWLYSYRAQLGDLPHFTLLQE